MEFRSLIIHKRNTYFLNMKIIAHFRNLSCIHDIIYALYAKTLKSVIRINRYNLSNWIMGFPKVICIIKFTEPLKRRVIILITAHPSDRIKRCHDFIIMVLVEFSKAFVHKNLRKCNYFMFFKSFHLYAVSHVIIGKLIFPRIPKYFKE